MRRNCLLLLVGTLMLLALPGFATPMSTCDSTTFVCNIYENQLVNFGFLAISGDVIVENAHSVTVDVFRIFNNVFNGGGGTGVGDEGFLFGASQLPDASTYSVNAVTVSLGPTAVGFYETTFTGNGDTYNLFTPVPEPSSLASLCIAAIVAAGSLMRRFGAAHGR